MTTNGKPPFKPATRENLAIACDNWRADEKYPEIVDEFVRETIFEAADSEMGIMAMKLSDKLDVSYMEAMAILAEVGMALAEKEEAR